MHGSFWALLSCMTPLSLSLFETQVHKPSWEAASMLHVVHAPGQTICTAVASIKPAFCLDLMPLQWELHGYKPRAMHHQQILSGRGLLSWEVSLSFLPRIFSADLL